VDSIEVDQPLRVVRRAGSRSPAYSSAGGKVLLAALPPESIDTMFERRLRRNTSRTIGSRDELHGQLARIREQAYAMNIGETDDGVNAIAVPIVDVTGRAVAAVSVAAPAMRFPVDRLANVLPPMRRAATAIVGELADSDPRQ
jgi:DNA-binding IclR family transcriptional regulator